MSEGALVEGEWWNDFDADLWSRGHASSPGRLTGGHLEKALAGHRSALTIWTVVADTPDPVATIADAALRPIEVQSSAGDAMFRVDEQGHSWLLMLLTTGHEGVFHLAGSLPHTDPRWQALGRWVARSAGRLMPVTLNEADFDSIASSLSESEHVEVSRLTARVLKDGSSYNRGWPHATGTDRPSYDAATAEIEGIAYVRSLALHVGDRLSVHLRRVAGATYYTGDLDLFEHVVARALAQAAADRRDLYLNRNRRRGVTPTTALAIELGTSALGDPDAIAELLDEVARPKRLGIAVLHRNPYLHFAVTDYTDGSNFDAFVTEDDRVVIHPGYRSTSGSLGRFVEIVSEHFATRSIAEVEAMAPPSLEDLLASG